MKVKPLYLSSGDEVLIGKEVKVVKKVYEDFYLPSNLVTVVEFVDGTKIEGSTPLEKL